MNPLFKWGSLTFCPWYVYRAHIHITAASRVINSASCPSFLTVSLYVCTVIFKLIDFWLYAIINYQKLILWVLPDLFLWDHNIKIKSVECGTQILLMIAFDQRMFCDCFWSVHVVWLIAYQIITKPVHTFPHIQQISTETNLNYWQQVLCLLKFDISTLFKMT